MKKIYLLNDYVTSKNTLIKIEEQLTKNYNDYEIISIDYSNYYQETEIENINLNSVIDFFSNYLNNNIDDSDILVGIGLSARILKNFKSNQRIYVNPIIYNNLCNVFCAKTKCFENKIEQFKIYLNWFVNIDTINFEEEYEWYSKHYSKIIKLTEVINQYELLKSLKNDDINLFSNNCKVSISLDDEVILPNALKKYLNKNKKKLEKYLIKKEKKSKKYLNKKKLEKYLNKEKTFFDVCVYSHPSTK
ncbi:MAG: hypothetical protein K2K73_00845, partial [Ureaplasma sp.]|nr:hypothetical protein [Ureaplasma sp.]